MDCNFKQLITTGNELIILKYAYYIDNHYDILIVYEFVAVIPTKKIY